MTPTAAPLDVEAEAHKLVAEARRQGLVLTIEQRSLAPPAMGHYETLVSVRAARQVAKNS